MITNSKRRFRVWVTYTVEIKFEKLKIFKIFKFQNFENFEKRGQSLIETS